MSSATTPATMGKVALKTQRGRPVMIDASGAVIEPKPFAMDGTKSEAWLQGLVHKHPCLLSVESIEPGIGAPVAVAMEVPCAHGFIDNILLTAEGSIIVVEVKLWSNPQARREVVAQALDYVAALSAMDYEAFEAALLKARNDGTTRLYDLVPTWLSEADFIDAVVRNLARGRVLTIVLGNGIREEVRTLAAFLQGHAGAHFTLALVQINLWADPGSGMLFAVPDTLAQTVMIERGIVVIDEGIPKVVPMPVSAATVAGTTMSSELFDEALANKDPALPAMLRAFVSQLAPIGGYNDQKASLHLLVDVPGYAIPLKLGYITKTGQYWTDNIYGAAPAAAIAAATLYIERLARLIDGSVNTDNAIYASTNGKSAPQVRELLRDHADAWYETIAMFVRECAQSAKDAAA